MHHLGKALRSQVSHVCVMIDLHHRRQVADAETTVHDLDREFAVWCSAVPSDLLIFSDLSDQSLGAHDVTGHTMAQEHWVLSRRIGAEVGIKCKQTVNSIGRHAEVVRDGLSSLFWYPAVQRLGLLTGAENQLLRLLVSVWDKITLQDRTKWFEVDLLGRMRWMRQLAASLISRVLQRGAQCRTPSRSITMTVWLNNAQSGVRSSETRCLAPFDTLWSARHASFVPAGNSRFGKGTAQLWWWDRIIDDEVKTAQDNGAFDNLRGTGKPLADDGEPAGEDWLANHLLRQARVLPTWLQLRKEIHENRPRVLGALKEYEQTRERLDPTNLKHSAILVRLEERYMEHAEEINKKIDEHNLRCPSISLEIPRFQEDLIRRRRVAY